MKNTVNILSTQLGLVGSVLGQGHDGRTNDAGVIFPAVRTNADACAIINKYWNDKGYPSPAQPVKRIVEVNGVKCVEYGVHLNMTSGGYPKLLK